MRQLLFCLLATLSLSACGVANQQFSCGPDQSANRIDVDQYVRGPVMEGTRYEHCF